VEKLDINIWQKHRSACANEEVQLKFMTPWIVKPLL